MRLLALQSTRLLVLLCLGFVVSNLSAQDPTEQPFDYRTQLKPPAKKVLARGAEIYANLCVNCHGKDGTTPQLPLATPFRKGPYKFGADPVSLMKTISFGNGLMGPQAWMTEEERFAVIHYIRETYQKDTAFYSEINLATLPEKTTPDKPGGPAGEVKQAERDYGPALASQYQRAFESALSVKLGDGWTMAVDLHSMDRIATWRDGFLDLKATQHQRGRGEGVPKPAGKPSEAFGVWQWAHDERFDYPRDGLLPRGPMPKKWMHYEGYTVHGRSLALHYQIDERAIIEQPARARGADALSTAFVVQADEQPLLLRVAYAEDGVPTPLDEGIHLRSITTNGAAMGAFSATALTGPDARSIKATWNENFLELQIPPSGAPLRFSVHQTAGEGRPAYDSFVGFIAYQNVRKGAAADSGVVAAARNKSGGPLNWAEIIQTPIEHGDDTQAYTLDTLRLPRDNPWNAWMRSSALAFFPDGRLALCTHGGDVWIASGLDGDTLRWKRFAAGLYEPFGLQVVDGNIYVTCKDRLVRLHDYNRDGEADFYESFSADNDVSVFFHAFNFDLQCDKAGNFYYAKSGQYTDYRLPGSVIKVSPDGATREVHCTGFRTPNGMGILPDGRVTVSDNQGSWMPASKVSLCDPGGFYGYVQTHSAGPKKWQPDGGKINHKKVVPPKTFDQPIIWMPQEIDNSSGGQLWVDDERWGPLSGTLVHTSFGKGWMYYMMVDDVISGGKSSAQATMVKLPLNFETGIQRARVNPGDGQVYATGLDGWNGGGRRGLTDGGLQRVRYTGAPALFLLDSKVRPGGIDFTFNFEPDPAHLSLEMEQWNYKWLPRYGSDQWSVADPDKKGRDKLEADAMKVRGNTLSVELPGLKPVHQLRVEFALQNQQGDAFKEEALMTINAIPSP